MVPIGSGVGKFDCSKIPSNAGVDLGTSQYERSRHSLPYNKDDVGNYTNIVLDPGS